MNGKSRLVVSASASELLKDSAVVTKEASEPAACSPREKKFDKTESSP